MHPSSIDNMRRAIDWLSLHRGWHFAGHEILEVGGRGETGRDRSYRKLFAGCRSYTVTDIKAGLGVDVVMPLPYELPFHDSSFGLVLSGQTLEHIGDVCGLMREMRRVLRHEGLMIHIAPSTGPWHDELDCWRFGRDVWTGIAMACNLVLLAHWIDEGDSGGGRGIMWKDNVGILLKP